MNSANDMDENDSALAAEYALGLLDATQTAAFQARLNTEPDLRAAYARWATDFAALTDDLPETPAPAHIKTQLDAALFPTNPPRRFGLGRWLAGAGAATAFALVLIAMLGQGSLSPTAQLTAEISAPDQSLQLDMSYDANAQTLELARLIGAATTGRALELWLIAGDSPPVSLGVLSQTPTSTHIIPAALQPLLAGATLAISDEPLGGSPTGAPTGAVLATGVITGT